MKTITEFSGFSLKDALAKKTALVTEGKTEEEIQAALKEALNLDDTKLPFCQNALDMTSSRVDRVKRVLVAVKAKDDEKVPEEFAEREGHFYLVEFFPDPTQAGRPRGGRDSRDGGRGGRGNDRGRPQGRGNPRDRNDRGGSDRRPRSEPTVGTSGGASNSLFAARKPGGDAPSSGARPARKPQAKRPPRNRAPQGPKGAGELRLVLKDQSQTTLQGSAPAETPKPVSAPVVETTSSSETPQA